MRLRWAVRAWHRWVEWVCGPVCVCGSVEYWCRYHNMPTKVSRITETDDAWLARVGIDGRS